MDIYTISDKVYSLIVSAGSWKWNIIINYLAYIFAGDFCCGDRSNKPATA